MYIFRSAVVTAMAVLALAACGQPKTVTDSDGKTRANLKTPPPRQPGLWETNVTLGDVVQTTILCIDHKVDKKVDWMGAQGTRDNCSQSQVTRQDDGSWKFSSTCDMGARGKGVTTGVAKGDFTLRYEAWGQQITTGANLPVMNGTRAVKVTSAWTGVCPKEWYPGDMSVPSGIQYNAAALGATGLPAEGAPVAAKIKPAAKPEAKPEAELADAEPAPALRP